MKQKLIEWFKKLPKWAKATEILLITAMVIVGVLANSCSTALKASASCKHDPESGETIIKFEQNAETIKK